MTATATKKKGGAPAQLPLIPWKGPSKQELEQVQGDDPRVVGEEYELSVADIEPDPDQPRLEVDAELADSIKSQGQLRAIEVRPHPDKPGKYMIVDGERRWRAHVKAGKRTIRATLTLEVEGLAPADRLVRQFTHNTGKPLTAQEKAAMFARVIADRRAGGQKAYGPTQLAKELGIAKSTVADLLALEELPPCWKPLIAKGPLQPSHAPVIRHWMAVPAKYHARALESLEKDYRWQKRGGGKPEQGERLPIDEFKHMLESAMERFIRPVSEVPGYKGPTMKAKKRHSWGGSPIVHAADPAVWQPIVRKKSAERRAKARKVQARAASTSPASAKADAKTARIQAQMERERKQLELAVPVVLEAVAKAVIALPAAAFGGTGPAAAFVYDSLRDGLYMDDAEQEQIEKLAPRGPDALAFVRHLVVCCLFARVMDDGLGSEWTRKEFEKNLKALGLKVDTKKIIASIEVPESDAGDDEQGED
jgi:ParB/RepB/Spo0J family partition protein